MLVHISDNIERSDDRGSLLADLRTEDGAAVSIDDGQRYWLLLGEHAWLWDYRLGGAVGSPRSLSWFYWNGICPPACTFGDRGVVGRDGVLRRFDDGGSELFESILTLPVRHFGTYAQRKDIGKIVFSLDGSAEGAVDAANIIKPALGRGEIRCLGATTLNEYRKYIEKDTALERRFQPVQIGEPTQ